MTDYMCRLLILGSVEDFTTLTKKAVERGAYVVVADAATDGEAKKYAHKAYNVNLTDADGINDICKVERIDRIITSFSDNLFELMVKYSHENGLSTYCPWEKVRFLRDKIAMKKMFESLGIPHSKAQCLSSSKLDETMISIDYPFVLKPLDGWGSKGMHIINKYDDLVENFEGAAQFSLQNGIAIIEELSKGHEINVQSWILDGEAFFVNFGDRETSGRTEKTLPYLTRQKYPSVYYNALKDTVKEYLERIASYVGIVEGPLSMQLFYDNGKICVGEVAGRFFGMEQQLSIISNGIDRNDLLLNMVFNTDENRKILNRFESFNGRFAFGLFIKGRAGIVKDTGNYADFTNEPFIKDVTLYAKPNMSTSFMPWLIKIFGCCESQEEADKYAKNVYKNLFIPSIDGTNLVTENHLIHY